MKSIISICLTLIFWCTSSFAQTNEEKGLEIIEKSISLDADLNEKRISKEKDDLLNTENKLLDVEKNSSSAMAWNLLALGHRYSNNVGSALKIYEDLLKLNPGNFLLSNTNF